MKKQALFLSIFIATLFFANAEAMQTRTVSKVQFIQSAKYTQEQISEYIYDTYQEIAVEISFPTGSDFAIVETESSRIFWVYIANGTVVKSIEQPMS